jgi:hypothetical protein
MEKKCATCIHWRGEPGDKTAGGQCNFPLPIWLIGWVAQTTPSYARLTHPDDGRSCPTWEGAKPYSMRI